MQSIRLINLRPKARKLVRKICLYQIAALKEILEETHTDTLIYEVNNELGPGSMRPHVEKALQAFEWVHFEPDYLPTLGDDELSIFKHILFNHISSQKYKYSKPRLWATIFRMEKISETVGLN